MGCDGGTIPTRGELVKKKQKLEAKDKYADKAYRWRYCSLSQELLRVPVVVCKKGHLYNKEAVIESLIEKSRAGHIKSLKDIKDLTLKGNPAYVAIVQNRELVEAMPGAYICPITGLEMTGKYPFVALWTCGCVFSKRALDEVCSDVCVICAKEFTAKDIVFINKIAKAT